MSQGYTEELACASMTRWRKTSNESLNTLARRSRSASRIGRMTAGEAYKKHSGPLEIAIALRHEQQRMHDVEPPADTECNG